MEATATTIRAYRPLLIAFGMVIVATYSLELVRSAAGTVFVHELMNAFMGFFFLVFAIPKLKDQAGFVATLKRYDIVSKRLPGYAQIYPYIELGFGVVLLSNFTTNSPTASKITSLLLIVVTALNIVGVAWALRQKQDLSCACLGAQFAFPLSKVAIWENGLMLFMAVIMVFFYNSFHLTVISLTHLRLLP